MACPPLRTFAATVRAHRRRLGFTQEELANKTGVSERSIRNLESGRVSSPRPATVRLLADAFELAGVDREQFRRAAAGSAGDQLVPVDALLLPAADQPTTVIVWAIAGTAEVGKPTTISTLSVWVYWNVPAAAAIALSTTGR